MKISANMEKLFNDQIQRELESHYLYLSMSTWFTRQDYSGFAHWMKKQAVEEMEHATKLIDYVHERSGHVVLQALAAPKSEWQSPMDAFEDTLAHELGITQHIYNLVGAAEKESDRASVTFLDWYVSEQVEEEANDNEIIAILKKVGDSAVGLYTLDRQLLAR